MIRFACPGCSATFTVGDDRAGKVTRCPKCQTKFLIPEPEAGATAPPPVPPPPSFPAPPPVPAANEPVEVAPCPNCKTRLSVMPGDLGLDVECPTCQTVFKALKPGSAPPAPPPPPPKRSALENTDDTGAPKSRRRRDDDEDDDDRPSRRGRKRDDDDEDEDRPSRRRRDDDEDDDDRPRKRTRRRRRGGSYAPHRGGLILTFGILGWAVCLIFGIMAWVMGSSDLRKMEDGEMDPEGQSLTKIGKMLGMVQCILALICLPLYFIGILAGVLGGAGK